MPSETRATTFNNAVLFIIPALIWGSTWLAIRFQLGAVDPMVSVAYRFLIATVLMFLLCRARGINLRLGIRDHLFIALQGLFLFGVNYWLVYKAEEVLPSGLVAVVFSGILFANVLNGRIFIGAPVRRQVVIGGLFGFAGIGLIFMRELAAFSLSNRSLQALAMALVSVYIASLGNILSARNQKAGLTVLQTNTLGMLYGGIAMLAVCVVTGKQLAFDSSLSYIGSLVYLSVFGSVVAFYCFLTLVGRIGADKAANVAMLMPVIALVLTTIFEGYRWTAPAAVGAALVMIGNYLALRTQR
jgi:drug/metabolite transporter (DMT)-like permease